LENFRKKISRISI